MIIKKALCQKLTSATVTHIFIYRVFCKIYFHFAFYLFLYPPNIIFLEVSVTLPIIVLTSCVLQAHSI